MTAKASKGRQPQPKAMIVAGVMSGTSADGVDVAICRVSPGIGSGGLPRVKLLAHRGYPYTAEVRNAVLAAMNAEETSTAALARLSWRLGAVYADAAAETIARTGLNPQLVALHGQTLFHETTAVDDLGAFVRSTWQSREARSHCGTPATAGRQRLPDSGSRRRRTGCAAGAHAGSLPFSTQDKEPHSAEPWRNRQPDSIASGARNGGCAGL